MTGSPSILGVILAGGQARRLGGGDKALQEVAGRPLLAHAIERLAPQVSRIAINANGDASRFEAFELPVIADTVEGFVGPLAGVLAGLDWAASNAPDCAWVVTVATDAPFFPEDLVARLVTVRESEDADLACVESGGRTHPVFGLWPAALREDLRHALVDEDIRKVDLWTARHRLAVVSFPAPVVDPFFNINRPEDVAAAAELFHKLEMPQRVET
ncbi:MAG: molybdenum cofactor guanylyltransferase MobA [Alphaproteobacteria bacterium]